MTVTQILHIIKFDGLHIAYNSKNRMTFTCLQFRKSLILQLSRVSS